MADVIIFTTPTCPYCLMAKSFFHDNNIGFIERDVLQDRAAAEEMVEKSGQLGVTVIQIDDKIIIGFDKPLIKELLGIKGS